MAATDARGLLLEAFVVGFLDVGVLPLDDGLRAELLEVLQEFALPLVGQRRCWRSVPAPARTASSVSGSRIPASGSDTRASVRSGSATSPTFIASIIFLRSADRSSRLIGPIRPALAREADSERSAASFSKLSPASARARIASARAFAASSAATLMPRGSAGVADEDLAQRDGGRRGELRADANRSRRALPLRSSRPCSRPRSAGRAARSSGVPGSSADRPASGLPV